MLRFPSIVLLLWACGVRGLRLSLSMSARKPLIAGNWKMNTELKSAIALATELVDATKTVDPSAVDITVIPPFPFLRDVYKVIEKSPSQIKLGAQTSFYENKGAFTGAVSAPMLKSCDCTYVLVGHSERRKIFTELDGDLNHIVERVQESGMTPIVCIGESKEEYELGLNEAICTTQLAKDLRGLSGEQVANLIIAYEPVWAIGTGLTASPAVAQSVHLAIRGWIRRTYGSAVADVVRILYGGSVTGETVDELMAQPDIDGALVGGASLTAKSFARIAMFNKLAPVN